MCEYQKQANSFCAKYGVKISTTGVDYNYHFEGDKEKRYIFGVKIKRDGKQYSFRFGQSIAAGNENPTNYDILACLTKYDAGSFSDFCSEFGYEHWQYTDFGMRENKKYLKIYKAVCKEWENVERVFSDCLDELREIQ